MNKLLYSGVNDFAQSTNWGHASEFIIEICKWRGKPENPEKNLSEQGRETENSKPRTYKGKSWSRGRCFCAGAVCRRRNPKSPHYLQLAPHAKYKWTVEKRKAPTSLIKSGPSLLSRPSKTDLHWNKKPPKLKNHQNSTQTMYLHLNRDL